MKFIHKCSLIITFTITIGFFSCDKPDQAARKMEKKQWVYVELITESKTDTSEYFYYGQIRKSLVDEISLDEDKKGLFTLSNIRLWNDDNLLELYEDDKVKGDLVFKIQDIEEMIFYKDDPVNIFDLEQLHETTLKIRKKNK